MADLIVLGGVFVALSGAFFVIIYFVFSKNPVSGRLEKISGIHEHKEPASSSFNYYYLSEIIKYFGRFGSPEEEEKLSLTKIALSRAGYRGEYASTLFFGSKTFLSILFLIISWGLLFCFANLTNTHIMFCALLGAATGFYLPNLWIRLKTKNRIEQIRDGFPDLLDLLVVCMGAGQGLNAALSRVAKEINMTNDVLGNELRLLNLEIRAGKSRKEALRNMADRIGLDDLSSLVTLINQAEEMGVSVAKTLRIHSSTMRTKRRLRAETIAAKIPIKITGPLMLFIFPCFMVVMVGPAVISIIRTFAGLK